MIKTRLLLPFSILILVLLSAYFFMEWKEVRLNDEVKVYLSTKGYRNEDILSIDTKIAKAPVFSARVIFSDEPSVTYYYRNSDEGIIQYGTPSNLGNNINTDDLKFKHQEERYK